MKLLSNGFLRRSALIACLCLLVSLSSQASAVINPLIESKTSPVLADVSEDNPPLEAPAEIEEPLEEDSLLPIDFSGGTPPLEDGYLSDNEYKDPTISVSIDSGIHQGTAVYIARVSIVHASQLRTLAALSFDDWAVMPSLYLSKRVKSVLALNGDYFCYTNAGHLVRQGVTYRELADGSKDVLVIDNKGDFHALYGLKKEEAAEKLKGIKVINSFNFGPVLVSEGKINQNMLAHNMAWNEKRQRMAIAQTGPLSYLIVCCGGPSGGSPGMTLWEFAQFVADQDENIRLAYNLDGGDSVSLIFRGKQVNHRESKFTREISDIIYFASGRED